MCACTCECVCVCVCACVCVCVCMYRCIKYSVGLVRKSIVHILLFVKTRVFVSRSLLRVHRSLLCFNKSLWIVRLESLLLDIRQCRFVCPQVSFVCS